MIVHSSLTNDLEKLLRQDLPGHEAQNVMSMIKDDRYRRLPETYKTACVMALLFPDAHNQLSIVYIKRAASHPKDKHAGQIGFPGGKLEAEDNSFAEGALREVQEEIGVAQHKIQLLGELSSLYVFASNFLVYPFVGFVDHTPQFIPQISEVADIVTVPIKQLFHAEMKKVGNVKISTGILPNVPYYDLKGETLWGATAMITSELEQVLQKL